MTKNVFLWCHVNLVEDHPERIENPDKRLASNCNYDRIEFLV